MKVYLDLHPDNLYRRNRLFISHGPYYNRPIVLYNGEPGGSVAPYCWDFLKSFKTLYQRKVK